MSGSVERSSERQSYESYRREQFVAVIFDKLIEQVLVVVVEARTNHDDISVERQLLRDDQRKFSGSVYSGPKFSGG